MSFSLTQISHVSLSFDIKWDAIHNFVLETRFLVVALTHSLSFFLKITFFCFLKMMKYRSNILELLATSLGDFYNFLARKLLARVALMCGNYLGYFEKQQFF